MRKRPGAAAGALASLINTAVAAPPAPVPAPSPAATTPAAVPPVLQPGTSLPAPRQTSAPPIDEEPPSGSTEPLASTPQTGVPEELPAQAPARQTGREPLADVATKTKGHTGAYAHEGFFMRLAVGPGLFEGSSGTSPDTRYWSGGAVSIEGSLGGAVVPGLVIGASFGTDRIFSLSSSDGVIDGDEPDLSGVRFATYTLSVFADFYPDPSDGLHFVASIGDGWLDVSRPNAGGAPNPNGPTFGVGGGYEWFVGPNVSLGILARANISVFSVSEIIGTSSSSVLLFVPALLGAVTYN